MAVGEKHQRAERQDSEGEMDRQRRPKIVPEKPRA